MTPRAARPVLLVLAVGAICSSAACDSVTYDATATTVARAATTTTTAFAPTGTTAELLASLAARVDGLSELLVEGEGQRESLARIQAEWALVRPTVEAERPTLLRGFDAVLGQVQRSVERRRPADADKAAKNLAVLIRAFEG